MIYPLPPPKKGKLFYAKKFSIVICMAMDCKKNAPQYEPELKLRHPAAEPILAKEPQIDPSKGIPLPNASSSNADQLDLDTKRKCEKLSKEWQELDEKLKELDEVIKGIRTSLQEQKHKKNLSLVEKLVNCYEQQKELKEQGEKLEKQRKKLNEDIRQQLQQQKEKRQQRLQ